MRCACGAELPGSAKFCGKCGKPVPQIDKKICPNCGKPLLAGAKFCGKCGAKIPDEPDMTPVVPVVPVVPLTPPAWSTPPAPAVPPTPITPEAPVVKPIPAAPPAPAAVPPVTSAASPAPAAVPLVTSAAPTASSITSIRTNNPVQNWVNKKALNVNRIKKVLIIVLIVGLCLAATGFAGRVLLKGLTKSFMEQEIIPSDGSLLAGTLNKKLINAGIDLFLSIVKNNPSQFVNAANKLAKGIGEMAGDPNGVNWIAEWILQLLTEEWFIEARATLKAEAGALWPVLQIMAYYKVMLTIGLIAVGIAALLLYFLDTKWSDVQELKLMPVFIVGCSWSGLVLIAAIIARLTM